MAAPNTLSPADNGVPGTIDAPGTGEKITQALFQRYIKPLYDAIYSLSLHKQDVSGSFATTSYVDNRVRTARVVSKSHANSPYSVIGTEEILQVDPSGGGFQVNLPDPALGLFLTIADTGNSSGTNAIVLHRHGTEKILGVAADKSLSSSGSTWSVWSDGTNWWVAGIL